MCSRVQFPQGGPGRPLCESVKGTTKFQWSSQDVRNARTTRHLTSADGSCRGLRPFETLTILSQAPDPDMELHDLLFVFQGFDIPLFCSSLTWPYLSLALRDDSYGHRRQKVIA